jgi:3-deoxy-D-manno-octulosonate 8-phosphate phosphatase KdsC-like HAD superfamily phosphatase
MNKGLAVLEVAMKLGVEMHNVLLAGNAINDIEMLDLDVGTSILVGSEDGRKTILGYLSSPETITTVDSPAALGDFLLSL